MIFRRMLELQGRSPTPENSPDIARLSVRRRKLQAKIETLAGLIKSKSIGTTPKRKDG
jgi:hypothetical protein